MLNYLRNLDWRDLTASAFVLLCLFFIFDPSPKHYPSNAQYEKPEQGCHCCCKPWFAWIDKDVVTATSTAIAALAAVLLFGATYAQFRELRRSIDSSARDSQRELRAYMGHLSAHFEHSPAPGITLTGPPQSGQLTNQTGSVKYFEKNSGRTPALSAVMFRHIIPLAPGQAPPIPNESLCTQVQLVQIVHPEQNFGSIVGTQRWNDSFLLYGYVDYSDIFGSRWRRHFSFHHDATLPYGLAERWRASPTNNNEEEIT